MVEGAIGDIIQSTPVFRKLKEDGYHVTLNCTPPAPEILKHSPYVDEYIVQIRDYVENKGDNLKNYWLEIAKSYDKHLELAGYRAEKPKGELFFSEQEEICAAGFRAKYANKFIVLWSLAGSSYHKMYPYFHLVLSELTARNPDVLVVSVGDAECKLMERMPSSRYLPRSGVWELRTSLVMTKWADLVIGPETGILNAAGCFPTPKITLLSHSTHENLC